MLATVPDDSPAPAPQPPRASAGAARTGAAKNPWPFLLLVVGICVAGWLLVSWMQRNSQLQDCFASGRRNCDDSIDPKLGR